MLCYDKPASSVCSILDIIVVAGVSLFLMKDGGFTQTTIFH